MSTTIQIASVWSDLLEPSGDPTFAEWKAAYETAVMTYAVFMKFFPGFAPSLDYGSMMLLSPGDVWTGVSAWQVFDSPALSGAEVQLIEPFIPKLKAYLNGLRETTWVSLYGPDTPSAPSWISVADGTVSR